MMLRARLSVRSQELPAVHNVQSMTTSRPIRAKGKGGAPRRRRRGVPPGRFLVTLHAGTLEIDSRRHEVRMGGQPIHLTPTEFSLLQILAAHPERAYRRETLLQQVWGEQVHVTTRTVDVHVSKLRHKLCSLGGNAGLVETVWGIGYRLRLHDL
jgi:DNA-binding response OmpR family regulator